MTIMKDNFSKMRSFMAKNIPSEVNAEELKKEGDSLYQKKLTNKNTIRKARAIAQKYNNK